MECFVLFQFRNYNCSVILISNCFEVELCICIYFNFQCKLNFTMEKLRVSRKAYIPIPSPCMFLLLLLYLSEQENENLSLYHALQECDFPTVISQNLKLTENIRKSQFYRFSCHFCLTMLQDQCGLSENRTIKNSNFGEDTYMVSSRSVSCLVSTGNQ